MPTAVFASNDLSAPGAMVSIREQGLSIPEDISIIGFDDIPQAGYIHPALTTVRQPLEQVGRLAVNLLFEILDHPEGPARPVMPDTELTIRDACRPPQL
jgi:LacI family transcriptional regulator